jgi:hypothetical protein
VKIVQARNLLLSAAEEIEQLQNLLTGIAETVNLLPSITGTSPVKGFDGIRLAIRDLQECYRDAARARNGQITGQEFVEMRKRAEAAESRLREMDWIPVSERVPENDKPVYVCHVFNGSGVLCPNGTYTWFAKWTGLNWYRADGFLQGIDGECAIFAGNITHWMPLPLPPSDSKANI